METRRFRDPRGVSITNAAVRHNYTKNENRDHQGQGGLPDEGLFSTAEMGNFHPALTLDKQNGRANNSIRIVLAQRGSLAGFAGEISSPFDMLAAVTRLGGAGRLVEHLAGDFERVEGARATEVERIVLDGSFSPAKEGAAETESEKPSEARGLMIVLRSVVQ